MFGARRAEFEKRQADAQYQSNLDEQIRKGREERANANKPAESPDTAEAMDAKFAADDAKRSQEVNDFRSLQQRSAYVKSQRDYFESVSEGMSAQGIIDRGGVQIGTVQRIGDGAAGIIAAGGQRKGGYTSLGSGADGIIAAGGQKTGPHLGIGASFREQLNAVRWGAGMQKYRTLARAYERKEREKKKNDGGLSAARQTHSVPTSFPTLPMMPVGGITFQTMTFDGARPTVHTFSAGQDGIPRGRNDGSVATDRTIQQYGRYWRSYILS
jgi:hypothetical protein